MAPPRVALGAALVLTIVGCTSTTIQPVASAAPSSSPPLASAAPGSDRYGLIVGTTVRSEADPRKIAELRGDASFAAVSPDGRRVAYWEATIGDQGARTLWLLDAKAPAQPHLVLTLPPDELADASVGAALVWSRDGTALLIGVSSSTLAMTAPPVGAERLAYAALREVDLGSGSVREIARLQSSRSLRPVAYDRSRSIAAAVEIGGGGYTGSYVLAREGAPAVVAQMCCDIAPAIGSPDAAHVLAVRFRPSAIYVWPTGDPERRSVLEVAPGERIDKALWRNPTEIVVLLSGDAPAAQRLEVWRLDGSRRLVLPGARDLAAVRPDGSAAIVEGRAVDLDTGATSPIATTPGGASLSGHVISFLLR